MADLKISEMTPAAELTGTELIECVQGGVNVKQELTGLKTWVNNGVQPSSLTLDALSSFNTNGIMVQTDTSEFIGRTITGTASQVTVTNGDGVSGNPTISLAASGVTAGTYGSSSAIPVPVIDTYGRITGITTAAVRTITGTASQVTVTNGDGVAGNPTISLPASGVTADTYGSATQVPVFAVNAQGVITSVINTAITSPTTFSDSTFRVYDNDDANKILAFEVSGIVPNTTGSPLYTPLPTTRTITMPNANVNLGDLPSVATTDSNTLSGTRNRILGGGVNTVSGMDNIVIGGGSNNLSGSGAVAINSSVGITNNQVVVINARFPNATNPERNSILLGTSTQTDLFKNHGTAAALRLNALYTLSSTIPVSGTLYATVDGSQTLSVSNLVLGVNDTYSCAAHEVEFIVCAGVANELGGVLPTGYFIAKRRIVAYRAGPSGTFFISAVQTIGTDITLGTLDGTITPNLSVDTTIGSATIHRLLCTITRTGGVAGQEVVAMSVRVASHHST